MSKFWPYVTKFEPARLRAVYAAIVALAATLGIGIPSDIDAKVVALIGVLAVVIPLLQGESTRAAVVPVAKVDELTASPLAGLGGTSVLGDGK